MSAIGSYAVIRRSEWPACLARARDIRTETTGRWVFTQTREVGREAFATAWQAALVREEPFDQSGYAIGNYLDAQDAVNGTHYLDAQHDVEHALGRVFTAGFMFDAPEAFPDLDRDRLLAFCQSEYGDEEAAGMVEAIGAAAAFYRKGMAEVTPEHLVVFVIR